MATPRAHDEEPVELVAKGTLHKKKSGGLGRHTYGVRSSPYVRRYFELTSDGVLSYWDESERRKVANRGTASIYSRRGPCYLSSPQRVAARRRKEY